MVLLHCPAELGALHPAIYGRLPSRDTRGSPGPMKDDLVRGPSQCARLGFAGPKQVHQAGLARVVRSDHDEAGPAPGITGGKARPQRGPPTTQLLTKARLQVALQRPGSALMGWLCGGHLPSSGSCAAALRSNARSIWSS